MHGAMVMLLALSGLGCQNKDCNASPAPQAPFCAGVQSSANVWPGPITSSGYPAWGALPDTSDDSSGYSCRDALRSTLWSFVLGHDPDVLTAREIEATFYSGSSGRY
jgi:hypothetical protein